MNRTFFIAWAAAFVAWMLGSFVVHGVLLHDDYARLSNLFRGEVDAQQYFPFMLGAHIVMAGALAWIYARGAEPGPWLPQGLRFGLAVALLTAVANYTIYYAVQPLPGMLVVKQIVFDAALLLLLGMIVAFVYRREARP